MREALAPEHGDDVSELKAGDKVFLVHNCDGRGTVTVQVCTVRAAGTRQITLLNADGRSHERAYRPDLINAPTHPQYILKQEAVGDIEKRALEIAASWIELARQRSDRTLAMENISQRYRASLEAQRKTLHEPHLEWLGQPPVCEGKASG